MREYLSRHEFGKHKGFRWRNASEISRIEGFSDAVFAFAVTLLVVSLEVPKTFDELMAGMHEFLPFAAAFSILFIIWLEQYRWFRQYGLQDGPSLWLNAALLFVVLFFTYPLKFLFTWLFSAWTGGAGMVHLPNGATVPMVPNGQQSTLMEIYGLGYLAVFLVLFLLHWRAWRLREELELTPLEKFITKGSMRQQALQMGIAVASVGLAVGGQPAWAGLVYVAIGPVMTVNGMIMGKRQRRGFGDELK